MILYHYSGNPFLLVLACSPFPSRHCMVMFLLSLLCSSFLPPLPTQVMMTEPFQSLIPFSVFHEILSSFLPGLIICIECRRRGGGRQGLVWITLNDHHLKQSHRDLKGHDWSSKWHNLRLSLGCKPVALCLTSWGHCSSGRGELIKAKDGVVPLSGPMLNLTARVLVMLSDDGLPGWAFGARCRNDGSGVS